MCGICGVAVRRGSRVRPGVVDRMVETLDHRGPDAADTTASPAGDAILGMTTLAIVTPGSGFGPFTDARTGVAVAYNGEIYDYRNVASRLGVELASEDTDGHFVLRAYLRLGTAFVDKLDGMFAIAIHDPRHAVTYLIRDAIGQKPLYYRLVDGELQFASETKALLGGAPVPVDLPGAVITVETPIGAATPYAEIRLVEAGTMLRYDHHTGVRRSTTHWAITDAVGRREPDWVGSYANALVRSTVEQRNGGDHALLLSGGVDSGVLAHLMRPAVCLTVRYRGYPQLDESLRAEAICQAVGSELVLIEPSPEDFRHAAPRIVAALDYPVGNASLLSEYLCYEAVSRMGLRVVSSGVGPDEHLLGYVRHVLALFGRESVAQAGLAAYAPLAGRLEGCSPDAAGRYLRLVLRGTDDTGEVQRLLTRCFQRSGLRDDQALTLVDQALSMPPLLLTSDKLSSAFGLERRSPYLSKDLMEISFAAPRAWRARSVRETKMLLRCAARRLGVQEWVIDTEHSKQGFASPVPTWLAGELRQWCDDHLEEAAATDPPPVLAGLLNRARTVSVTSPYDRTRLMGLLWALWWSAHVRSDVAPLSQFAAQGVA